MSFAQKFQKLYDNIYTLFPNFRAETGSSLLVDPSLAQGDRLSAPLVFNQLNFMYQKVKQSPKKEDKDLTNVISN